MEVSAITNPLYNNRDEEEGENELKNAFRIVCLVGNWEDCDKYGPTGYVFNPTDEELLDHYLRIKKYGGGRICKGLFGDLDLYQYDPQNIPQDKVYRHRNGRMYIFTPVHKLHINGRRNGKRDTPNGHWKMNASLTPTLQTKDGRAIGTKSSLVFFDKERKKTQWLMYEFRLEDPTYPSQPINGNMLDDCVLAVVYAAKADRQENETCNDCAAPLTDLDRSQRRSNKRLISVPSSLDSN